MSALFDSLAREHRLIAEVLGAFGVYLDAIEAGTEVDPQDLTRFIVFYVDYVDYGHHVKEAEVLFRTLERHGWQRDVGPLAHLDDQHAEERHLLREVRRIATLPIPWSASAKQELLQAGRAFIAFEDAHMKKEKEMLYPAASPDVNIDAHVVDRLARHEKHFPPDVRERLEVLARDLIGRHRPAAQ